MPINVVQANPNATIGGVVQAQPNGTIGTISKLPPPPALSVAPAQSGGVYNPQGGTPTAGMVQPAATSNTLMPNTQGAGQVAQPASTAGAAQPTAGAGAFNFMDGSGFDSSGNYQAAPAPTSTPQFTPEQLHTAMSVALAAQPNQQTSQPPQVQAATQNVQMTQPGGVSPYPPGYDPTQLNSDIASVNSNMQVSPAELQAQQQMNDLTSSENFGLTKIEQDPNLVMPLLVGQQQALQHQAENQAVPLQQQLAMAQAKRQGALNASQFALSRDDVNLQYLKDQEKPQTIQPGQTVGTFNQGTQSFNSSYTAPYTPIANPLSPTGITTFGTNGSTSSPTSLGTSGTGTFSMGTGPGTAASVNNVSGLKGADGKFVQYATPQDSLNATAADIQNKINGNTKTGLNGNSTLDQFVKTWITGNANSTQATGYNSTDMAKLLGVTANTPISQIGAQQLAGAVAHFETGYTPGNSSTQPPSSNILSAYTGNPMIDSGIQLALNGVPLSQISAPNDAVKSMIQANALKADPTWNDATNQANYDAKSAAEKTVIGNAATKQATISAAHSKLQGDLSQIASMANQVNVSGVPNWDNFVNGLTTQYSNNPQLVQFAHLINTARSDYAVISSGGQSQPDDNAMKASAGIIPSNGNAAVYTGLIQTANGETQRQIQGQQTVLDSYLKGGSSSSGSSSATFGLGSSSSSGSSSPVNLSDLFN